jgi:hypothetical protein
MITARNFGTALGPHVMRDRERLARLCTLCTRTNRPPTVSDPRKCVTATYWGSSGRRFKSCQPDQEKWALSCDNADSQPQLSRVGPPTLGTTWVLAARSTGSFRGVSASSTARRARYARLCRFIRLSREALSCAEVVCCSSLVVARKSISLLCDQGSHREVVSIWGPWPAAVRRPLGALREAAGERILGRPQHG